MLRDLTGKFYDFSSTKEEYSKKDARILSSLIETIHLLLILERVLVETKMSLLVLRDNYQRWHSW